MSGQSERPPPNEARLHATTDAMVWADEFCRTFSVFVENGVVQNKFDLMMTWFANAIEVGRDAGRRGHAVVVDAEPLCRNCDAPIVQGWVHAASLSRRCFPTNPGDMSWATPDDRMWASLRGSQEADRG